MKTLEKIRSRFREVNLDLKPKCPHCGHGLKVEKTDFFETEMCENCFEYVNIVDVSTCCREPFLRQVKLITTAGTIQVRQQCKCGFVTANSIGGLTPAERDGLPLVDMSARDRYNDTKYAFKREFERKAAHQKRIISKKEFDEKYSTYLQSPEWRNKRALVLRRDNHMCQSCLVNRATQVHHKSYVMMDFTGSESCFDLVSICSPCHNKIHNKS